MPQVSPILLRAYSPPSLPPPIWCRTHSFLVIEPEASTPLIEEHFQKGIVQQTV